MPQIDSETEHSARILAVDPCGRVHSSFRWLALLVQFGGGEHGTRCAVSSADDEHLAIA